MRDAVLSIIVPVFNEGKTIRQALNRLLALPLNTQIIVVDNGSTDGTSAELRSFMESPRITMIHYDSEQGKGAAVRRGLREAGGEYVVIQDGDLEYDPEDLVRMFRLMEERRLNALFGSRILNPQASASYRRYYWGGRFLSWLANRLFGLKITDEATCYKMIKRDILLSMDLQCVRFEFCPEVVAKLGLAGIEIEEIPIAYNPRSIAEGKKIRWIDGLEAICTLLRLSVLDFENRSGGRESTIEKKRPQQSND
ncbi:MAG: glycosyltransferase family 2 protein [Candidatus Zixiibacteriota bacterium]